MILFRAVNGIGLGVVQPLLFSLVADKSSANGRGQAFGYLLCTGDLQQLQSGFKSVSYRWLNSEKI